MRKKKRRSLASLVGCVSVCLFGLDIRVELLRVHSKELGLFSFVLLPRSTRSSSTSSDSQSYKRESEYGETLSGTRANAPLFSFTSLV